MRSPRTRSASHAWSTQPWSSFVVVRRLGTAHRRVSRRTGFSGMSRGAPILWIWMRRGSGSGIRTVIMGSLGWKISEILASWTVDYPACLRQNSSPNTFSATSTKANSTTTTHSPPKNVTLPRNMDISSSTCTWEQKISMLPTSSRRRSEKRIIYFRILGNTTRRSLFLLCWMGCMRIWIVSLRSPMWNLSTVLMKTNRLIVGRPFRGS